MVRFMWSAMTDGGRTPCQTDACNGFVTPEPAHYPMSFRVHQNGVKLTFDEPLDADSVQDIQNLFAQQWNYKYSNAYGSPEFSVKSPDQEGHDILTVKSAHLLNGGKTPLLKSRHRPGYDRLRTAAQGASLQPVELNIFMTALHLDKPFTIFYYKNPVA